MDTDPAQQVALLRLLQLASPMLPVGAFGYSQGLEWAVENGDVSSEADAHDWILGLAQCALARLDVPLFCRLHDAWAREDFAAVHRYARFYHACRESAELRAESRQIGRSTAQLLADLGLDEAHAWRTLSYASFLALFTLACARWQVPISAGVSAYVWSWVENQVSCAMKLVPLGQTAGQRILSAATALIPSAIAEGLMLEDDAIGSFAPRFALASALHETQYTRLFRS